MNNALKITSKTISIIFHPIFMPLVGLLILFNSDVYEVSVAYEYKRYVYILVALFSVLLPASVLPLMQYWRVIKSVELNKQRERFLPLLFTSASLIVLHMLIKYNLSIRLLNYYSFVIAVVSICVLIANTFIKVSLHMSALGGLTGLIIMLSIIFKADLFLWMVAAVLVSGAVASSRLFNRAHTTAEILIGYMLGITTVFGLIFML